MIEIKEILCPIDFSDVSRRTLQFAAATARWYGSRLTVLHVVPLTPPANVLPVVAGPLPASYGLDDSTRVQLTDEAVRFAREVAGHEVPMNVRVVEAPQVHVEIVEQAKLLPADLIIIGTHGRSGYERLFLGSVAEKVLRTATVPVLVVPSAPSELVTAGDAAFDRILCAVDFSPASLSGLTYAMSFAQEADAHLDVLSVIELTPQPAEMWAPSPQPPPEVRAAERAEILTKLRALIPAEVHTYCRVETMVEEGKPYREILRVATERRSDLIVIGSHSHGALGHLFFGSNAGHIVRGAPCPVLAISPSTAADDGKQ